jgi:hypothetical protein
MSRYRSPAIRLYLIRLSVLMAIYLVTLFVASRLLRAGLVEWPSAYLVATSPRCR